MTLLRAISLAGGFNQIANRDHVTIRRQAGGKTRAVTLSVQDIIDNRIQDLPLQAGHAATGDAPAVVTELDGKHVRIGGYVVPLDFEATSIKEFLLVPFVGACIHVPPPPPNQIIYVKTAKGFDVAGSFDPVYVTGTLKVASQYTGLAETGYTIDAEKVEMRKE